MKCCIAEALKGKKRDNVDHQREVRRAARPGGGFGGYDARPAAVKNFLAYSLRRLGTDYIDIYRPARASIPRFRSRTRSARSPTW